MRPARGAVLLVALALAGVAATTGCDDPPLLPRSRVVSPRVLAIIAEPPEARPGQTVNLRVVAGGTTAPPTFRWYVCARPEATTTFTAQSSFGVAEPNAGCFPGNAAGLPVFALGQGEAIAFPVPADLLQQIDALARVYGGNLSPESLRRIAQTSGLTMTLGVEMITDTVTVRAIKRVVVVDRERVNTNPPPPTFALHPPGDAGVGPVIRMVPAAGDSLRCEPDPPQEVVVRRRGELVVAPSPDEDPWLEAYDSYDATGGITPLRETAFYAFFATAGDFAEERSRPPLRDTTWTAPNTAGTVTHWVAVRDGRGGMSICSYAVRVE
jgi:hypothetical protein